MKHNQNNSASTYKNSEEYFFQHHEGGQNIPGIKASEETKEDRCVKLFLKTLEGSDVIGMDPTGDCFYEAIVTAFNMHNTDVRDYRGVVQEDTDDKVKALRRTAANFLTQEVFQKFQMSHTAGLVDYKFMSELDTIVKLQEKMLMSGREVWVATASGPMSLKSAWFVRFSTFAV